MHRPALILAALAALACPAHAGGGPETTLVVVNDRSPLSKRIANEYAALRDIPANHLVYLEDVPVHGTVSLADFKSRIWTPVQAHMEREGLEGQIDLVTYSAGFPYGVVFRSELGEEKPGMEVGGVASLTGVTYLVRRVLAGERFWLYHNNSYFRIAGIRTQPPRQPTEEERQVHERASAAMAASDWAAAANGFEKFVSSFDFLAEPYYNLACARTRLGETDRALAALRRAVAQGFANAAHAGSDADLASVREHPAFRALLDRMRSAPEFFPAHGFRAAYTWASEPEPVGDSGSALDRYFLCTQLGYTGFKGNDAQDVLECLRSAAASDGTRPDGTVYVLKNDDVRSKAREFMFDRLVETLGAMGRKAEVLSKEDEGQDGVVPARKDDVIGAVMGIAGFSWAKSKSRILPGAICEHLTSHGANFGTPGQTKISEFFRHGAAGSSGTVTEPLSIHQKFPNPMIHAYYAEGCSLAEAFYQSVWGPYQLMVAGDGLARPFARFREVEYRAPAGPWSGTVTIEPVGEGATFELWVDGRRVATGAPLAFDTTAVSDGYHEVRVVAVENDRIETRSYRRFDAEVRNGAKPKRVTTKKGPVELGEKVGLRAPGARGIVVYQGARVVAESKGMRCEVDTAKLGPGPSRLTPVVALGGGKTWRAETIELAVLPPEPAKGRTEQPPKAGLLATAITAKGKKKVEVTHIGGREKGKKLLQELPALQGAERIVLEGYLNAPAEGLYEVLAKGAGTLILSVADRELARDAELGPLDLCLPVSLGPGWHRIEIELEPRGAPRLEIMLSGDVEYRSPELRH